MNEAKREKRERRRGNWLQEAALDMTQVSRRYLEALRAVDQASKANRTSGRSQ